MRTWKIEHLSVDLQKNRAMVRIVAWSNDGLGATHEHVSVMVNFDQASTDATILKLHAAVLLRDAATALSADVDAENRSFMP
jgi:hypothetical protein